MYDFKYSITSSLKLVFYTQWLQVTNLFVSSNMV